MKPFFSVITPSFNQGAWLEACIHSVVEQRDESFEHLIFDNCSTDSTSEVLARHSHIHAIVEPDRGQSHAINKGFEAAQGEIICWLNSDDAYAPGAFEHLRHAFADPAVSVVYGDVLQINYDGTAPQRAAARFASRDDLVRWWSRRVQLHQPAVFFRRSAAEAVGPLREDLHYVMDYEYWWRLAEHHRFHYLEEILATQHRQPESKTIRNWHRVYEEREAVFSPYYDRLRENVTTLERERKLAMAERYLTEAYACLSPYPEMAWKCFLLAVREKPSYALHPRALGLLRRWMAR